MTNPKFCASGRPASAPAVVARDGNILPVPAFPLTVQQPERRRVRTARRMMAALLLAAIAIGATACEFGEHRGSHSNVYPDDRERSD